MPLLLNIDVPDLAVAQTFYSAAFDLTLERRWTATVAELRGWPVRLFLLQKATGSTTACGSTRDYARHWTPIHVDVVVQDMAVAYARAIASGATSDQAPTQVAYGSIAMLADPFGNGFCLIEFAGNGYEAITDPASPLASDAAPGAAP